MQVNTRSQNGQLRHSQAAIATQLLITLLGRSQPTQPISTPTPILPTVEFSDWLAIIVPDSQFYVKLTVRRMTELFSAATYGQVTGTYTNQAKEVEEEINWLVISWCNAESLNEHWQAVLEYATHLQQALKQECIGVIRNGSLVLVRHWD